MQWISAHVECNFLSIHLSLSFECLSSQTYVSMKMLSNIIQLNVQSFVDWTLTKLWIWQTSAEICNYITCKPLWILARICWLILALVGLLAYLWGTVDNHRYYSFEHCEPLTHARSLVSLILFKFYVPAFILHAPISPLMGGLTDSLKRTDRQRSLLTGSQGEILVKSQTDRQPNRVPARQPRRLSKRQTNS